MPGGDRTGPMGMGAMTGRTLGYCAGFDMPGYAGPGLDGGYERGFGRGRGFRGRRYGGGRHGWRHWFYATGRPGWMRFGAFDDVYQPSAPEVEKQILQNQVQALQSELDIIQKRLSELQVKDAAE